jgi:voltage-gated potassium channel
MLLCLNSTSMQKKSLSHSLFSLFYSTDNPLFGKVNDFLAFITLLSVLGIVLETVPSLYKYNSFFFFIEWITVFIFSIEYISRIIAHGKKAPKYIFSFFGLIDIISILPSFLGITNLTFLKTVRTLRIIRLLRMLRIAKMISLKKESFHKQDATTLSILLYGATLFVGILFFGTLMYLVEGFREEFSSIPLSMLWALKVTLGGIPQHIPSTLFGEYITISARFFGLLLFGLLLSITHVVFKKFILGEKENDTE